MAECVLCTAEHTGTALVCSACATRTAERLRQAADLWPCLRDQVLRRTRSGDPTPRAGRPAPAAPIRPGGSAADDQSWGWPAGLPVDLAASEVADAVRNTVTTWARVIVQEVGADLPTGTAALLRWLAGRCQWMRHQPWAGEALDELAYAGSRVWAAVDRPPGRRYLGPCACGTDLNARPGADTVTCTGCGTSFNVGDQLQWLNDQVDQHCYTAAEIADAYGIRADRIRQWASRGRIAQRGTDRSGRPLYALPEVLELARPARAA